MPRIQSLSLPFVLLLLLVSGIWSAQVQQVAASPEVEMHRPGVIPDRIVLSWTDDPARSHAVTWRTDTSVSSPVAEIGIAGPGPEFELAAQVVPAVTTPLVTDFWTASYHTAIFRQLAPDTLYAYRVGNGAHWSEWLHFRTASDSARPFTFIYFGDVQNSIGALWPRVLHEAFRAAPEARFLAFGGDLVNHGGNDAEWGELFRAGGWIFGTIPVVPVPGNHEYEEVETDRWVLSSHWRAQFALPENGPRGLEEYAYYVDYQGARIISLNSMEMISEQTAWLKNVLSDNPDRWTIVVFHYPLFSLAKGRDNPELRAAWKPVFDKHQVDLVLTGHDHTYARSALQGATVYVSSVSGAKMYDLDRKPWMRRAAEDTQLFQIITVGGDTLSFEARTATGELYDAFELRKQIEGPNLLVDLIPSGVPERLRQRGE